MHSEEFAQVFVNTLLISVYKIVLLFPLPILIALILNEVRVMLFKRLVQTIIYMPHFLVLGHHLRSVHYDPGLHPEDG